MGDRVLVIGCCGAGKSIFSRQLSEVTRLPCVHLDQQFWQPGWCEPDKERWAAAVEVLIAEPSWIIDGNYLGTLPLRLSRADTAIFLDFPRTVCLWRSVVRILRNLGRTRNDMAPNCPERFDWSFLKYVWSFRRVHRPRVLGALNEFEGNLIVLETPSSAAVYLQGVRAVRESVRL